MEGQRQTDLWWEEARRAVWGRLTTCCSSSVLVGAVAQEGALGAPVRSRSQPRQTRLLIDRPCGCEMAHLSFQRDSGWQLFLWIPISPRTVRVCLQVFVYKTPPPQEGRYWVTFAQWVDTLGSWEMLGSHHSICVLCHITGSVCLFGVKWINVHEWQSVTWTETVRKMFPSKWFPLCTHKYIPLKIINKFLTFQKTLQMISRHMKRCQHC